MRMAKGVITNEKAESNGGPQGLFMLRNELALTKEDRGNATSIEKLHFRREIPARRIVNRQIGPFQLDHSIGCLCPTGGLSFCPGKEALIPEPFREPIRPVVGWQPLLVHAESVAAFRVDVQLNRVIRGAPGGIKMRADPRSHVVVRGAEEEQRRRIGGTGRLRRRGAVDRRDKVRAAGRVKVERHAERQHAASGKAQDADPIRGNTPFGCSGTHEADGLAAISSDQGKERLDDRFHLVRIVEVRPDALREITARLDEPIFQHKGRDPRVFSQRATSTPSCSKASK